MFAYSCNIWYANDPDDDGGPGETHIADFARRTGGVLADRHAAYGPIRFMCEYEVSYACPAGWIFYKDDGTEGYDSCVYVSPAAAASWNAANSSCSALGSGAHLLTINSALGASSLLTFATTLSNGAGNFLYAGCFQLSDASERGRDWYWVDNTDNTNLNCGTGAGAEGCNLWGSMEPSDGGTSGMLLVD